jgi:alanyl-tRNA synthetase
VPPSVLLDVEQQVNEVLTEDLEVRWFVTSQAEARRLGAMALFGEKYGDRVRVVEVGEYARELCGGTHVARSGQLGLVKILSEASIGSGVRRVEALVGLDALQFSAREHILVSRLADLYKVKPEEVGDRVEQTIAALRDAEKELEKMRAQLVLSNVGALADAASDVNGVALVTVEAPEGTSGNDVRTLAQEVRGRIQGRPGVVAVASRAGGKASLVVAVNAPAKQRGLDAQALVKGALSGRGGGSADLAQGGGVPADDVPSLLAAIERLVREA